MRSAAQSSEGVPDPELLATSLVEDRGRIHFPEAAEKFGLPPHWVARTRRASRECLQDSRSCSERVLAACGVFTDGIKNAVALALISLQEPPGHLAVLADFRSRESRLDHRNADAKLSYLVV